MLRRENQHSEMTQVMHQCLAGRRGFEGLSMGTDLSKMSAPVSQNLWEIDRRLGFVQIGPHNGWRKRLSSYDYLISIFSVTEM